MVERLLTVPEAAASLALKPSTIRRWILTRKIDVVRPGARAVRVPEAVVAKIIKQGYRPAITSEV
jgi:excisionase family DNA binding protein